MDSLRKPFFIAALALIALVVLLEIGALGVLKGTSNLDRVEKEIPAGEVKQAFDALNGKPDSGLASLAKETKSPGRGIPSLALIDGLLLFTVALIGVGLLIPQRVTGRLQGTATLAVSLLVVLAAIATVLKTIGALITMLALLLAVPFGTVVYLVDYGSFRRAAAAIALSLLMTLKLGFAICLVLAQQRFLQNIGLVLLIITSFVATALVSILHGLVPGFLVSITDAIAAIVVGVLAAIWALFLLIGSIPAIIKAIQLSRA